MPDDTCSAHPSERLLEVSLAHDIPLICTFELTRRCNLKCLHCYLGCRKPAADLLSTARVKRTLRELAAAGTLTLTFTGGEVFLRKDILDLCEFARSLSFELRLFTNGTLVTKEYARCLSGLSMSGVEISLYGRENTHDRVTGVAGSHAAAVRTLRLLRDYGIKVTIKAPLMTLNYREYPWLMKCAKDIGAAIKFDPVLTPLDDGGKKVLRYRLPYKRLSRIYADKRLFPRVPGDRGRSSRDLFCSAGHNVFSVSYDGTVYPCLQLPLPVGNIRKKSFSAIWSPDNAALAAYRGIDDTMISTCNSCALSSFCNRCPGLALVEDGSILGPASACCAVAKIMRSLSTRS